MFTKDDLIKLKAFKSIVEQGDFQINGKAVVTVGVLFKWFLDLEKRIEAELLQKEIESNIKVVKVKKEPIKKVGE